MYNLHNFIIYIQNQKEKKYKQALQEHCYRVFKTTEIVTVPIPSHLVERLFSGGTSLTINLKTAQDSIPVHLPRPVSRTTEEGDPPTYKEVTEGWIESRPVDPEISL